MHDLGDAYLKNRGKAEMRYMWPHRSLIDEGIPAPGHSDASICNANPWLAIYSMVTRKTSSGKVLYAKERITPIEAVRAYTIDGAYAAWEENIKGSIEPGKLADLTIVDRNPLKIPKEDLKNVTTVITVIGGNIMYNKLQLER
jgi:predicted amidohydrolase YtcJ